MTISGGDPIIFLKSPLAVGLLVLAGVTVLFSYLGQAEIRCDARPGGRERRPAGLSRLGRRPTAGPELSLASPPNPR